MKRIFERLCRKFGVEVLALIGETHMLDKRIGFIGTGKMGEALMRGILNAGLAEPKKVFIFDADEKRMAALAKALKIQTNTSGARVVGNSDIVFIALKPGIVPVVIREVADRVTPQHLIISIAAGVPIAAIECLLPAGARVVRVMSNTPCVISAAASAFALGKNATTEDAKWVKTVFDAVGKSFLVEEKQLDAVTGLSGSGPAYVSVVIEALADGGVRMGLSREVAMTLAAQTVFGASKMLLESNLHPAQLKDMVASPGGTTVAGLHALERAGLRAALMNAVEAATVRSKELGETAR
jgi:pyrroline-5-carboxylate reductase